MAYVKTGAPLGRPRKWPEGTETITMTRRVPTWLVAKIDELIRSEMTGPGTRRKTAKVLTRQQRRENG